MVTACLQRVLTMLSNKTDPICCDSFLPSCLASFVLDLEFNFEPGPVTGSDWGEEESEEKEYKARGMEERDVAHETHGQIAGHSVGEALQGLPGPTGSLPSHFQHRNGGKASTSGRH